jgi:hypothetical protein
MTHCSREVPYGKEMLMELIKSVDKSTSIMTLAKDSLDMVLV